MRLVMQENNDTWVEMFAVDILGQEHSDLLWNFYFLSQVSLCTQTVLELTT